MFKQTGFQQSLRQKSDHFSEITLNIINRVIFIFATLTPSTLVAIQPYGYSTRIFELCAYADR